MINAEDDNNIGRKIRTWFLSIKSRWSIRIIKYLSPFFVIYLRIKDSNGTSIFYCTTFGSRDDAKQKTGSGIYATEVTT